MYTYSKLIPIFLFDIFSSQEMNLMTRRWRVHLSLLLVLLPAYYILRCRCYMLSISKYVMILISDIFHRFGDMVALQKNNTLNDKLEYVAFTLIFILFGLAVVAASLDLLVLRFVTMNTEDERRDEAEALQVILKDYLFINRYN